jgi:glycine/D-amino acid oxidase-like deaminating enzyme
MAEPIAGRAVVIGAGISGLSAAAALSEFFSQVIILERDELPDHPAPRPSVAHPKTRGVRPAGFDGTLMFAAALTRLAAREPETHKLMTEVQHFLRSSDAYREPALMQRIKAEMASVPA